MKPPVVVITRNRVDEAVRTVRHLRRLGDVRVVQLEHNVGAAARNVGVQLVRAPFVEVGGFHPAMMLGGEEQLLACDLRRGGWDLVYCPELLVRHLPSPVRDRGLRRRLVSRNALWFAWLRRPVGAARRTTARTLRIGWRDTHTWAGVADAARGAPWVIRERTVVPRWLAAEYELLDRAG